MLQKFKTLSLLAVALLMIMMAACGGQSENDQTDEQMETAEDSVSEQAEYLEDVEENPIVTISMADYEEDIIAELYPDIAPNTVTNFISLIEDDYYNGQIFHRVVPGFMIQGGDPEGDGSGGPGYSIAGEFSSNGFENNLQHDRGILSMSRTNDPNSAGSQFFIMTEESPHLDTDYAAFGEVTEGMDVVDNIVDAERDDSDKPLEDQQIESVEVDTKGYDYPEPEVE
ncbi:peptidyl-prolyl cis-trans isomerase B (cyclophilin B) [Virgibacillus natechei]|uniref:Peptidyl-prolyl cis-trans isomerase n=1 Tax=Virgibacillus natechei TaxID=1216297 RepID=A0ABS4IGI7_9BACI|nr:peptidylprolyl isomerase [Virgibacillus natechei]MBP1970067.1 peptidyl-prolyl cis-trans isomerase B (cyclophilin B) [Virgibacillus natechei]UZD14148.1 peptidylprolyl isomerase [Virgibacillus natechei]